MTTEERRRRRFSESFRKEQVALIESGKASVTAISRLYQVKPANVRRWLKKYGTKKLPEPILITNSSEINRLRELEKENAKLKQIIGEQQVKVIYQEELIKLAEEKLEEFRKKMMVPLLLRIKEQSDEIPMEHFYKYVGITRQGFYKSFQKQKREEEMISLILPMIENYRKTKDRRAGSRSLYYNLGIKNKFKLGVNKFEKLLSVYELTLLPLDIRIITTKSSLQSWNYDNLIKGKRIRRINEVIAVDIAYVNIGAKRYYLFCLTDLYSYRIVGCYISNRMRSIEAKVALKMVIKLRGPAALNNCIHHTDGGSQYFSKNYMNELNKYNFKVSVAGNCLENGHAEQRNGLIKNHLIPTMQISDLVSLRKQLTVKINYYNYERKQEALGWLSPVEFENNNNKKGNVVRTIYNHK